MFILIDLEYRNGIIFKGNLHFSVLSSSFSQLATSNRIAEPKARMTDVQATHLTPICHLLSQFLSHPHIPSTYIHNF